MRNEKQLLDSFTPEHEKEWDARLFIDSAVKNKVEFTLEVLARALSGKYEIKWNYSQGKDFSQVEHIETDNKKWVTVTKHFKIEARMSSYIFYGNSKTDIYLKIIDFWAGKQGIFPCGAASLPNREFEVKEKAKKKSSTRNY